MNSLERAQKRKIAVFGKKKCTLLKESLLQFLCVKAISEKVISYGSVATAFQLSLQLL